MPRRATPALDRAAVLALVNDAHDRALVEGQRAALFEREQCRGAAQAMGMLIRQLEAMPVLRGHRAREPTGWL